MVWIEEGTLGDELLVRERARHLRAKREVKSVGAGASERDPVQGSRRERQLDSLNELRGFGETASADVKGLLGPINIVAECNLPGGREGHHQDRHRPTKWPTTRRRRGWLSWASNSQPQWPRSRSPQAVRKMPGGDGESRLCPDDASSRSMNAKDEKVIRWGKWEEGQF